MTTWPNPAAPGVPDNAGEPLTEAELEAMEARVVEYDGHITTEGFHRLIAMARNTAAQVEAARREEHERCASVPAVFPHMDMREALETSPLNYALRVTERLRKDIRALPTAPTPALDAVVQRAEQRVFEECATQCERTADNFRELAKAPSNASMRDGMLNTANALDSQADAIRSRAPGGKEG